MTLTGFGQGVVLPSITPGPVEGPGIGRPFEGRCSIDKIRADPGTSADRPGFHDEDEMSASQKGKRMVEDCLRTSLEPSTERFEAVLRSISDGVFTINLDNRIICFNHAAEEITGIRRDLALGRPCHEILRADICHEACPLRYTIETGQPVSNLEITIHTQKFGPVPVSVSTGLFKDKNGRLMGGVETFRDLREVVALRETLAKSHTKGDIVSKSRSMQKVLDILPTVADSGSSVLITGENGVGKEMVARAIHRLSPRANAPFVAVNCGGMPQTLIESELFGYEPGAFTGAEKAKKGRFALAEGGTLLLDEIGELPLGSQVKLLRVLQERRYEPLGGTKTLKADIRLLSITNRDLEGMVETGAFRQDLFYRINVIELKVPPLRERMEDVPLLVDHFIRRLNLLKRRQVSGIDDAAMKSLLEYNYPGNIRELENAIEHGLTLSKGSLIQRKDLPDRIRNSQPVEARPASFAESERQVIWGTLKKHRFNRSSAARELGIHKTTLYRKIKRLRIELPSKDGRSVPRD